MPSVYRMDAESGPEGPGPPGGLAVCLRAQFPVQLTVPNGFPADAGAAWSKATTHLPSGERVTVAAADQAVVVALRKVTVTSSEARKPSFSISLV